jgi:hypothetical protein
MRERDGFELLSSYIVYTFLFQKLNNKKKQKGKKLAKRDFSFFLF